ncbi:FYVE zinc finger-domain-containing protein [Ephemerocybe angulata]|uniref:FYVE zinc finger-domain-containing protein n=1 Tax=Ephemerocybe angulata TaxID=980116 RepID=A0A8H6IK41_9AGAR|nr:FYVE zinc finger-domain-containing protein [Tulosesus angulatus]
MNSSPSSSNSSLYDAPTTSHPRPNEHLAVLLPKHLWKPDSNASMCDNLYCRVSYGLFERRHHCRKCGGCFCGACSSRTTPLLDTSALPFVYPPRHSRIADYESPESPIVNSRVCEDCWDQLHGVRTTPHTPARPNMKRALSHPISVVGRRDPSLSSRSSSHSSLSPSSPSLARRPSSLRPSPSNSSLNTTSSTRSTRVPRTNVLRTAHLPLPLSLERSYGELDAYPLKRSSVLCKATGGGRWEPKQNPILDGYRPPVVGGKAPFEIEMEKQEKEERRRRENPVIHDGDFKYRFVRHQPKTTEAMLSTSPFCLSTF